MREIPQSVHSPRGLAAEVGGAHTIGWTGDDVVAACGGIDDIAAEISRIQPTAALEDGNQSVVVQQVQGDSHIRGVVL